MKAVSEQLRIAQAGWPVYHNSSERLMVLSLKQLKGRPHIGQHKCDTPLLSAALTQLLA